MGKRLSADTDLWRGRIVGDLLIIDTAGLTAREMRVYSRKAMDLLRFMLVMKEQALKPDHHDR